MTNGLRRQLIWSLHHYGHGIFYNILFISFSKLERGRVNDIETEMDIVNPRLFPRNTILVRRAERQRASGTDSLLFISNVFSMWKMSCNFRLQWSPMWLLILWTYVHVFVSLCGLCVCVCVCVHVCVCIWLNMFINIREVFWKPASALCIN